MEKKTFENFSSDPNASGYPLFYIVDCNYAGTQTMCANCCTNEYTGEETIQTEANWENHNLYCDVCSNKIEAAYEADVEEEDSEYIC